MKETRLRMDAIQKTELLEEHVWKQQRKRNDNATAMVDNGDGGGMVIPSWVVGGGNGRHRDGLGGEVGCS